MCLLISQRNGLLLTLALVLFLALASAVRADETPVPILATACPPSIPFGELFDCSLEAAGEVDRYTFTATTNDSYIIRIVRTSGTFEPSIVVRNPNGVAVCERYTFGNKIELDCTATSSGAYSFEVQSSGTNRSTIGGYQVYMQRLNGVGNATPLSIGSFTQGSLAAPIESKTYSFTAAQNDLIRLRLFPTAGTIHPRMRVYNAAGVEQCAVYRVSTSLATIETCAITAAGTYSLLVDDNTTSRTGAYDLHFQRLNNPGNATPLTLGSVTTGNLERVAAMNVYRFDAEANDQVILRLIKEAGAFLPQMTLFDRAGVSICSTYSLRALARIEPCAIPATGQYSLLIEDQRLENTGAYRLHLQRRNNPGNPTAIAFGQSRQSSIASIADFGTFSFEGVAGGQVRLTMLRTNGSFWAQVSVYDPAGLELCTGRSFNPGVEDVTLNCTLKTTGQHTIITEDRNNTGVGDYTLTLACLSGSCSPAAPRNERVYLPLVRR
ncbi:PPC domain-containing protein [Candidatus Chloroploca sp. M-50]|uniref:PPC domain-containing protein n=1 Tax=Candidatus Chloroploca mongolica TaxID=2528176 RepID=A0ABS4DFB7_9CHLR|nr:PPC domain-containing protein [Candidatus Chloroploca mongolica]MBP1468121.1 PPC domain-containing protein [Candidatus Chloroploca mongolica]